MPHLKSLHEKHSKDGLVILAVHSTRGGEKCAAFTKAKELPYPVAVDVETKTQKAFRVDSFPDYYVVDRAGKLRFADLANSELSKVVKKLLAEPEPTAEESDAATPKDDKDEATSG